MYGNKIDDIRSLYRLIQQHCPNLANLFVDPYHLDVNNLLWNQYLLHTKQDPTATTLNGCILRDAGLTDDVIVPLIQQYNLSLETLDVAVNRELTERSAFVLATLGAPRLREINLERCSNISEAGLCALFHACPTLEIVDVSYNPNVTDGVLQCLTELDQPRDEDTASRKMLYKLF
ncbi:hypothetical protein DFQ28_002646 [Apophysomyces sp. BC1034]|nr:hypothetical protein DFQ28_002646 [Apophysomyces sp. BC1034]